MTSDDGVIHPPPVQQPYLSECHEKIDSTIISIIAEILQRQTGFVLPVLHMPEFNGNLLDWIEFWDTFEREIHNDRRMPITKKLVTSKHC